MLRVQNCNPGLFAMQVKVWLVNQTKRYIHNQIRGISIERYLQAVFFFSFFLIACCEWNQLKEWQSLSFLNTNGSTRALFLMSRWIHLQLLCQMRFVIVNLILLDHEKSLFRPVCREVCAGKETRWFFSDEQFPWGLILRNIIEASAEKVDRYLCEFVSFTEKLLWWGEK